MNLKLRLESILNRLKKDKKAATAVGIACFVVIIAIIIGLTFRNNAKEKGLKDQKRRYSTLCSELNSAINDYNNAIEKLNGFLEIVEPYHVITNTTPLPLMQSVKMDFQIFVENGSNFSEISQEIENIISEKNMLISKYSELCQIACKGVIDNYNVLAEAYNTMVTTTSIDFIKDIPKSVQTKEYSPFDTENNEFSEEVLFDTFSDISAETNQLAGYYILVDQITNPDEQWIIERLSKVESITANKAVTKSNDPNGLLNKEGGYTSCIYFSVKGVDQSKVKGRDIIEKGTDAGGAIEAYPSLEAAKNRCDYLSQFDNTLLYSGSYAIIGTMVVRTSYQLTTQEQIALTNEITNAFTEVE